jgi:serine/threonine-protein kinase
MSDATASKPDARASDSTDEAELVRLSVAWKLVTAEEIRPLIEQRQRGGATEPLLAALLANRLVTPGQADRLLQELAGSAATVQQIPGYQLLQTLGQGCMGVVYKARQLSMDRVVAVKVLRKELSKDPQYVERFVQEAKFAAKLSHNDIVQAIDVGEAFGHWYFVMEYIEGTTLGDLLDQKRRLSEPESLRIVRQIAQALDHAHRRGLIHRDVKPRNIMITKEGVAKLADLGLARKTDDKQAQASESGRAIGTPYYISPEQARGDGKVDIRADIYSLGATWYHMVTGRPAFVHSDPREVLKMHVRDELVPPDHINTQLSDGCGLMVEKMMAKRREERYATPADLLIDLECLLANKPPKLAQERVSLQRLEELTDGEAADDLAPARQARGRIHGASNSRLKGWLTTLAVLLGLSILLNLVLVLR